MLAGTGVVSFITANLADRLRSLERRQEHMETSLEQIREHLTSVTQGPDTN